MEVAGIKSVRKVANRVKRQAVAQVPPLRWAADSRHQRRQSAFQDQLPRLGDRERELVGRLDAEAISVSSLPDLGIETTAEMQAALDALIADLAALPADGASTLRPTKDQLFEDLSIWRWGLQERMLGIVENYIGMPARYYGADLRREVADGQAVGVRQWHRDIEDRRMIKILVWLNDVDDDGGPFAYVPVDRSVEVVRKLRYVGGFVSDDRLRTVVPDSEWIPVTGPKWTTLVADNTRLVHRATPPRARDRYSVTFTWSSRHPAATINQEPLTPVQLRRLNSGLDERQLACLPDTLRI